MRQGVLIALLFAVLGCAGPQQEQTSTGGSDTRQIPSNYEPGVHISGYATVGLSRRF